MGTFSLNTTVKIDSAVGSSGGGSASHSVPANCYAIVNCSATSGNNFSVTVGGLTAVAQQANTVAVVYVGPGQTVTVTTVATAFVSGVQFRNSP
jgi:hypothetical protein